MQVKVTGVAQYKGHSLNENGSVNLSLKFKYDQLVNVVQLTQLFSNDIVVKVKMPDVKPIKLGMFRLKSISFDHDGEGAVKLNGLNDYIEVDNLNQIVTTELFQIQFLADVEMEEETGGSE